MPQLGFLSFLSEPWFVLPWYGLGALAAAWVLYDGQHANSGLPAVMKGAWPIIVFFFSVIGLALYFATSRPPRKALFARVTGAAIHCVGGDGLGIVSAMVIARLAGFSFWEEYWFEYAVGFAFGWFIFQYLSMRKMAPPLKALWMGGRAEFFSMMTVMAGMGVVMGVVTPLVVGQQPKPDTFAFWGFAMLGLAAGFVLTYPMNYWLVKVGWKHGM